MPLTPFYTFLQDIRPFGNGSPIAYRYDPAAFAADALGELVSGEMAAFDTTNKRVVRFVRTASAGKFVGITRDSAAGMKKLGNQPALALADLSVFSTGVHELVGTAAEVYSQGDPVYMSGTDTQKVTKTAAGGTQIGIVHNPLNKSIVGAVRVPVLIDEFTVTQA